jgi:selenide,water dikinase
VQTVDFFTPIVDDPYLYGQIAAANALSDVYAMGGRPMTALAIAALPRDVLDTDTIRAIFLGGFDKLGEAGVALLGGHTVQDPEIKFGYAVTGVVDPARVLSNALARPGDALILTKPIGTGIVATAIKFARVRQDTVDAAVQSMVRLNRRAAEALRARPAGQVHACTDVTGFGLVGHAHHMAMASGVTIEIEVASVPVLEGVPALVPANRSGGLGTNLAHFGVDVEADPGVDPDRLALLYDPQTSGGLLAAVAADEAEAIVAGLQAAGEPATRIGTVLAGGAARIRVRQGCRTSSANGIN